MRARKTVALKVNGTEKKSTHGAAILPSENSTDQCPSENTSR